MNSTGKCVPFWGRSAGKIGGADGFDPRVFERIENLACGCIGRQAFLVERVIVVLQPERETIGKPADKLRFRVVRRGWQRRQADGMPGQFGQIAAEDNLHIIHTRQRARGRLRRLFEFVGRVGGVGHTSAFTSTRSKQRW